MNEKIFDNGALQIWNKDEKHYLRYDSGAHQVAIREDEISFSDVERVMHSDAEAMKVLLELQKRLIKAGIKPYKSNI